jgi:hypothetical protein
VIGKVNINDIGAVTLEYFPSASQTSPHQ